jgi:hypothetical protein
LPLDPGFACSGNQRAALNPLSLVNERKTVRHENSWQFVQGNHLKNHAGSELFIARQFFKVPFQKY